MFAGIGWDATLVHDYHSNLARARKTPLAGPIAGKLNEGLGGYLFSLFTRTVPGEIEQLVFKGRTIRVTLSRPMPFQIGGDVIGLREQMDFKVAAEKVDVLDWTAVRRRSRQSSSS